MAEQHEVKEWTVIFLVDDNPPKNVILLERSQEKSYAPGFFTGIGGKVGDLPEFEHETPLDAAYRELEEETEGDLNKENLVLNEFARCVYEESGLKLYYFWAEYDKEDPPHISPSDGNLVWVSTENFLQNNIIPTTQAVCMEWSELGFRLNEPFTVFVKEIGQENTVRLVEVTRIEVGLR